MWSEEDKCLMLNVQSAEVNSYATVCMVQMKHLPACLRVCIVVSSAFPHGQRREMVRTKQSCSDTFSDEYLQREEYLWGYFAGMIFNL